VSCLVYISSSWKQRERVRAVAVALRAAGLDVYDFTDPACRGEPEIPPEKFPRQFDAVTDVYAEYITSNAYWRRAVEGNRRALDRCDAVLLLLPCGADAHADWAYAVGRGKRTAVVGSPPNGERTPSHLWSDALFHTDAEGVAWCATLLGGGAT
jgi:hypothetical protein